MLFDYESKHWSEPAQSDAGDLAGWLTDGNFVYFKLLGNYCAIMRVNPKTQEVEQVVSLAHIENTGYGGGVWIGLTPGDSPFFFAIPVRKRFARSIGRRDRTKGSLVQQNSHSVLP